MMKLPGQREKLSHAYLIEGNVQKNFEDIQDYLLQVFGIEDACNHVDVNIVDSQQVDLNEIKEMIRNISIQPHGQSKIYLILYAQNLSVSAQNALLKTLEEPPEYAFFFLFTENSLAVLSTLRSRCIVYFTGYHKQDTDRSMKEDEILFFEIVERRDMLSMRKFFVKYLSEREELSRLLDGLMYLSAMKLKRECRGNGVQRISKYRLIRLFDILKETKNNIDANVNAKASIDFMILTILEGED